MKKRTILAAGVLVLFLSGCHLFDNDPNGEDFGLGGLEPPTSTLEQFTSDWDCTALNRSCQDVFELELTAGDTVSFATSAVGGGSVSQLALYAPGTTIDGTNLFTDSIHGYRCTMGDGCETYTAGESVTDFLVAVTGTYKFAVIRHWGHSCGNVGSYTVTIQSDSGFGILGQTMDNVAVHDDDYDCGLPI
jgi:hypothetical protein